MKRIRVLIVDDHEIVREGLQTLLAEEPEFEVVGTTGDGAAAVDLAQATKPDVIVMDLVMPGLNGIEATRRIVGKNPQARVLVLTTFADDQRVREAIQAGATGYLLRIYSRRTCCGRYAMQRLDDPLCTRKCSST